MGGMNIYLHSFLNSVLNEGEWLQTTVALPPGKKVPDNQPTGSTGQEGSTAGTGVLKNRIEPPIVKPVA
jgi:hypothetical protein